MITFRSFSSCGRQVLIATIAAITVTTTPLHAQTAPAADGKTAADSTSSAPPAAGSTPSPSEPVTKLGGVVVKGHGNPLIESDRRLKKLQKSLPDLNSEGKKATTFTERMVDRALRYLSGHSDPNKLNDQSKAFLERSQHSLNNGMPGAITTPSAPPSRSPEDTAEPACSATGTCPK